MKKIGIIALITITIIGAFFILNSPKPQPPQVHVPTVYEISNQEITQIVSTDPLWYQHPKINPLIDGYFRKGEDSKSKEIAQHKYRFINLMGDLLEEGKVQTGEPLTNFDFDRTTIDTIVIHHTETNTNADFSYIHGIHLFTLYVVPTFDNPSSSLYGKPIFSGHYDENGKQVFYGYHYLVKPNGTYKQTLTDNFKGYHARKTNARSIGISLIGNYDKKKPTEETIATVKNIIKQYGVVEIVGHRDVVDGTECPGDTFYGKNGWRNSL